MEVNNENPNIYTSACRNGFFNANAFRVGWSRRLEEDTTAKVRQMMGALLVHRPPLAPPCQGGE